MTKPRLIAFFTKNAGSIRIIRKIYKENKRYFLVKWVCGSSGSTRTIGTEKFITFKDALKEKI